MNTTIKQYAFFFSQLGYSADYYPDKQLFYLKEARIYAKICPDPAPPEIIKQAKEQSKKHRIVLLEGALTFRMYDIYENNHFSGGHPINFVTDGDKYSPVFFDPEYSLDFWPKENIAIAVAINMGEDIVCQRCGSINDFEITKPSLHYKATCKCGCYITNISDNKPSVIHFGKYKGRPVLSMITDEEIRYLKWALEQGLFKGKIKRHVEERIAAV